MKSPLSTINESPFNDYFSCIDGLVFYGYNEYSHEGGVKMLYKKKVASQDFTSAQLPKNRIESILDICKSRFMTLLGLGLILGIFGLPMLVHLLLSNITVYEINLAYSLNQVTQAEASTQLFNAFTFRHAMNIPLLMLLGIGLSGVTRILRQLLWQEPIFIFHDFKLGVQSTGKYTLLMMGLFGIINLLFQIILRQPSLEQDTLFYISALMIALTALVFILLLGYYSWVQNSLYQLTFKALFKNSLMFAMRYFFKTIASFMVFLPWLLLLLPYPFGFMLVIGLLTIVILPVELLILLAFGLDIMDQTINQYHHPSIYRKGLWPHE